MRWILSLCFIVQFMGAKEITEALQAMQFDTTKQDLLREAVGSFIHKSACICKTIIALGIKCSLPCNKKKQILRDMWNH